MELLPLAIFQLTDEKNSDASFGVEVLISQALRRDKRGWSWFAGVLFGFGIHSYSAISNFWGGFFGNGTVWRISALSNPWQL